MHNLESPWSWYIYLQVPGHILSTQILFDIFSLNASFPFVIAIYQDKCVVSRFHQGAVYYILFRNCDIWILCRNVGYVEIQGINIWV